MIKKIFFLTLMLSFSKLLFSQNETAFIRLTDPLDEFNASTTTQKFIIGSTCKSCMININEQGARVYATGAFVFELKLSEGLNEFTIKAYSPSGSTAIKKIQYTYTPPKREEPVRSISIERIQTFPEGDLLLKPGDAISFRVKALTGCALRVIGNTPLYEMPDSVTKGMSGIYQGKYIIQPTDLFNNKKISVILTAVDGTTVIKETNSSFSVMSALVPDIIMTKGRLAHLEYGLGDDRLGGAKIGYIDSLIPLKVVGKVGTHYKVRLAPSRTAYIPDELVTEMPIGTFAPSSLTGKLKLFGNAEYDYVQLQLFSRLPYQSFQLTDPSKIVVDVFGATNNTNWIDQLETAEEVKKLEYEQIADDIFRITISLKHHQHWGHRIYYEGNNLIIKIKQQPESLSLRDLTIAIDAGHGGSNTGAGGATGVAEKDITMQLSLKLMRALEKLGTNIIMTRMHEEFVDNKERILFYRDSTPDLLLSIHLNSSADPLRVDGTSTFYRYEGFRPLSRAIYKRMLELDLNEYGNNGSFNFMLNSPTEYPNALIETLFLSNPEEEMKILDDDFQDKMVGKIVEGLKDFLNQCKQ
jgi:N-acetylmuramoyl-L-alanine amidase